jgi:hypothetical protein
VALAIVLACECFAAHGANEGALVCVCAQMGPKVVRSRETLRTESALERGRVFLLPATLRAIGWCPLRVGEIQYVVSLI